MSNTKTVEEILRQGRPDNLSSWRWIVAYFEYQTSLPYGSDCFPLLRIAQHLATTHYAQKFRAGQSVDWLIISTKEENGLDETDPHITIHMEPKSDLIRLEYWRAERRDGLVESHICSEGKLLERLKSLLLRLWTETKGNDSGMLD